MVVAHAGTGFDCASPAEIDVVLSLGVPPERIIYAHPVKSPAQVPPSAHTLSPTMLKKFLSSSTGTPADWML